MLSSILHAVCWSGLIDACAAIAGSIRARLLLLASSQSLTSEWNVLQDLYKTMDHGSGTGTPASVAISSSEPFLSGTFEYGLGRTAANRKVYFFLSKAQDNASGLHDASVSFVGVFKTDKQVRATDWCGPPCLNLIWRSPVHGLHVPLCHVGLRASVVKQ